jgi:steroid delta-isomerase-like uncharacterized protein
MRIPAAEALRCAEVSSARRRRATRAEGNTNMTRPLLALLSFAAVPALLLSACAHTGNPAYKKDVATWYEAFNTKNPALIDQIMSASWEDIPPAPDQAPGREGAKQILAELATAFPDLRLTIKDVMQDGDKVIVRAEMTGTQTGTFMGAPPTNRKIAIQVVDIHQFENGKVIRSWHTEDWMTARRQLAGP